MPRHVRVGFRRYSALQGIDLTPLKTWEGRIGSMETLINTLVNSLRRHGFRPFRPLEASRQPNDSYIVSRLTGLRDISFRLRLPWRPKRVTCALSIDLHGRRLLQKRLQDFSYQGHQVVYDASVEISAGVAVFRGRQWKSVRRANFSDLVPDAVENILNDLKAAAAPNGAAGGLLFERSEIGAG